MKTRFLLTSGTCLFIVILITALSLSIGCRQNPKATTRESLEFIKQVYTACNTKDTKRLTACEARFSELKSNEKISKAEIKSFQRVLDMASKGEWGSAQDLALQFAKDQVR